MLPNEAVPCYRKLMGASMMALGERIKLDNK